MSIIATFGDLVFEVSSRKVNTINNLSRTIEARYEKHEIKHQKPLLEFEGPDIDPTSFDMQLRAELGINPVEEIEKWKEYAIKGKRALLLIGNNPFSNNAFVITKITENYKRIDNKGVVFAIDATVEMLEYPVTNKNVKKTIPSNNNNSNTTKKNIGTMTIIVKSVHIRSGPGVNYKVLGYGFKTNSFIVYRRIGDWYDLGAGKFITASSKYSTFKGVS